MGGNDLVTTYGYNARNLLTGIEYSDGTSSVTNEYSRIGQPTRTVDAFGEKSFQYDPGTLVLTNEVWTGMVTNTLARTYDSQGRAAGIDIQAGGTTVYSVAYDHDALGRFDEVDADIGGDTFTWSYTRASNSDLIEDLIAPSNITTHRAYESHRDLIDTIATTNRTSQVIYSKFDYTNDDAGRRTGRIDTGTAFGGVASTNVFGYNARSEVTSADMGNDTYRYGFDQIGNRLAFTNNTVSVSYTPNQLNQYTDIDSQSADYAADPVHDNDGNLTDYQDWDYSWNGENRMVVAEDGETKSHWGQAIIESHWGQAIIERFALTRLWSGGRIVATG